MGEYAFYNNKLTEVNFADLPNLKQVSYKAFLNNTGVSTYDNQVVIWNEPRESNVIPSTSTFIVNPETPIDEDYVPADFRYGMENGQWSILGFTDSGLNKLLNGRRTIVFPATDPNGREVTGFGKDSFAGMNFDKADLSNLANLKVIGNGAFENATVAEFDFTLLPNLTTIGDSAFKNTKLPLVDFSNNPELSKLGSSAFNSTPVKSVKFENNTNLTKIENYSFENTTSLTSITFTNLPNVNTIGYRAFSGRSTLDHDLDLTGYRRSRKLMILHLNIARWIPSMSKVLTNWSISLDLKRQA